MRKYVIIGVQGSGKGTQAQMLAADLDMVHISVGDIFRWNVQNHTKMGAQVRRIMAAGELVGDDLAESVVRDRLTQHVFVVDARPAPEVVQEQIRKCLGLPPYQAKEGQAACQGAADA